MRKRFNTTGLCYPEDHYMVRMEDRLQKMEEFVEQGKYFTINRGRQYGKTTMLNLLARKLSHRYVVFLISFEGMEDEVFETTSSFCKRMCKLLYRSVRYQKKEGLPDWAEDELKQMQEKSLQLEDLSDFISELCDQADRPVVLMIDEVDQAGNDKIFLTFLGMLRRKFQARKHEPAFQAVILAGVYDIKNLKLKIRSDEEHQYNSPWNIASEITLDMSFSITDIAGMLEEYEQDNPTGMDIGRIAGLLYDYTCGYPFLVSRLCVLLDEVIPGEEGVPDRAAVWTREGVVKAVKKLLMEPNTLFDDMLKKLSDFPDLKEALHAILFNGQSFSYNTDNHIINIGHMFGFVKNDQDTVAISNRIFETRLYNLFLSEDMLNSRIYDAADIEKNRFICGGRLNMELVLERFAESFTDIYSDAEESFLEENGRRFFLLYLKPIINGVGNYYVEARTRNMKRTDVVVDYRGEQYVCELKIWHGDEYNNRGEQQLLGYLEDYHLSTGYMLSFNINKKKKVGVQKIQLDGRTIVEAVV